MSDEFQIPDDLADLGIQNARDAWQIHSLESHIGTGTYVREGKLGTEAVLILELGFATANHADTPVETRTIIMEPESLMKFIAELVMGAVALEHHLEHHQGT